MLPHDLDVFNHDNKIHKVYFNVRKARLSFSDLQLNTVSYFYIIKMTESKMCRFSEIREEYIAKMLLYFSTTAEDDLFVIFIFNLKMYRLSST